jgi:hypothetical protein
MYYCGDDASSNPQPGRLDSSGWNAGFVNPWGSSASCGGGDNGRCYRAYSPDSDAGYRACASDTAVITVWHQ